MEDKNKQKTQFFGKWWEPNRKWFYPTWLIYELSIRFYDYAIAVHQYFTQPPAFFASLLGEMDPQAFALLSSVFTFLICTIYLTVPSSYTLFKFFIIKNLTGNQFEDKMKKYF